MPEISTSAWTFIAGLTFSLLTVAYSAFLLARTRKDFEREKGALAKVATSSLSSSRVDPDSLVLRLLALSVPAVGKMLSTGPKDIRLQIHATSEGKHEATLIGTREGTGEYRVEIDLNKDKGVATLVGGLRDSVSLSRGGPPCPKAQARRRKKSRRPKREAEGGSLGAASAQQQEPKLL